MILITIVVLTILPCPADIRILLSLLLFTPVFWDVCLFGSLILFGTIPLLRYGNNAGIYNLSFTGRVALFAKIRFKLVKGFVNHPGLGQVLPKQPIGLGVRNVISQRTIQESYKRETIPNVKLGLLVRKILQRLENQNLEHQYDLKRFPTRTGFEFFVSHNFQDRKNQFLVHFCLNAGERIVPIIQLLETNLPMQQTGLHHHGSDASLRECFIVN